jgi:hypothetical protein
MKRSEIRTLGAVLGNATGMLENTTEGRGRSICPFSRGPNEDCKLPPEGTYLQMMVVPRMTTGLNRSALVKGDEPMGVALFAGERAYAFFEPARAFAAYTGQSAARVLGCVMAHEAGHPMGLRHGPSGVMKAKFQKHDIEEAAEGRLHFNAQDYRVLRASIGN